MVVSRSERNHGSMRSCLRGVVGGKGRPISRNPPRRSEKQPYIYMEMVVEQE